MENLFQHKIHGGGPYFANIAASELGEIPKLLAASVANLAIAAPVYKKVKLPPKPTI